jgi:aspartate oxidase
MPYDSSNGRPQPHAVVVGSGFGGLAAAIRLGARAAIASPCWSGSSNWAAVPPS